MTAETPTLKPSGRNKLLVAIHTANIALREGVPILTLSVRRDTSRRKSLV
jgi:hypothetical protein